MECQERPDGSENWSVGGYQTEPWQQTAWQLSLEAMVQAVEDASFSDLISGNIDWPGWTYTRLFPDYFTLQVTLGPFAFAGTVDDYSNVYISGGGSIGPESIFVSGRLAGGWIAAKQEPSENKIGVEWNLQDDSPSESLLERFHQGWAGGGGAGLGLGVDGNVNLTTSESLIVGVEGGLYSPQASVGVNYGLLAYDNNSNAPWFPLVLRKWQDLHQWWGGE